MLQRGAANSSHGTEGQANGNVIQDAVIQDAAVSFRNSEARTPPLITAHFRSSSVRATRRRQSFPDLWSWTTSNLSTCLKRCTMWPLPVQCLLAVQPRSRPGSRAMSIRARLIRTYTRKARSLRRPSRARFWIRPGDSSVAASRSTRATPQTNSSASVQMARKEMVSLRTSIRLLKADYCRRCHRRHSCPQCCVCALLRL
jgi:hypothetical protein